MSLDFNISSSVCAETKEYFKMVKSMHHFRSLAYVEHLKLMPSLPTRVTSHAMIDTNPQVPKQTSRSLSSPGVQGRRELIQGGSRTSQQSLSPTQSHKSESPVHRATPGARSNSSPASTLGSGKLSPTTILRPLEIQSPNSINLQLPPTCGAKQLAKLKRFLTTLQSFGSDISSDIGDRVRSLVLALVNKQTTIEEFHSKLQETTNFPLKPFVIPFLKATLPTLQRELQQCAQISRQSPQQYLASNERLIFDTSATRTTSSSSISPEFRDDTNQSNKRRDDTNQSNKRRDDTNQSNKRKVSPTATAIAEIPPPKRLLRDSSPISQRSSRSPPHTLLTTDVEPGLLVTTDRRQASDKDLLPLPAQINLGDISRLFRSRLEEADFSGSVSRHGSMSISKEIAKPPDNGREDEDWRRVKTMLGDVANLVEKTQSAMTALQESRVKETQEFSLWMRKHAEGIDQDFKKRTGEIMTQTIRQSEDRIAEVRRRADEMVNEVKRQAIVEIHQAVTAAELKANELVNQEKLRMESVLNHIKKTSKDEATRIANKQSESPENCWNCGRRASETCSGCNKARYCGQFCQHKDWDRHHTSCGGVKNNNGEKKNSAPAKMVETKQEKTL